MVCSLGFAAPELVFPVLGDVMGMVVVHARSHELNLFAFVKDDEGSLVRIDLFVDPELALGDPPVSESVATLAEI
jgi:hypothetical protein